MKRFLFSFAVCLLISVPSISIAQVDVQTAEVSVVEAGDDVFHRQVIRAAVELNRKGELSRRDVIKLRVAMISPAFREKAQELAVIQMNASGSENAPGPDVDPVSIDWDGLSTFLEKLVPLILMLIQAFSAG